MGKYGVLCGGGVQGLLVTHWVRRLTRNGLAGQSMRANPVVLATIQKAAACELGTGTNFSGGPPRAGEDGGGDWDSWLRLPASLAPSRAEEVGR